MRKKPDAPCAGCPWLSQNQTPTAVKASPVGGDGQHWFSLKNLSRHWRAVSRLGHMLPCHVTDKNAPLYGGKFTKAQDARICVGLAMLAKREVCAFMTEGSDFSRYAHLAGRRFSSTALAAWTARLYYAGAIFHVGSRTFTMPTVDPDVDIGSVTVPWAKDDAVHGGGR